MLPIYRDSSVFPPLCHHGLRMPLNWKTVNWLGPWLMFRKTKLTLLKYQAWSHGPTVRCVRGVLTVWLFNMNWTALNFTSFLTLLYVNKGKSRRKHTGACTSMTCHVAFSFRQDIYCRELKKEFLKNPWQFLHSVEQLHCFQVILQPMSLENIWLIK